HEQQGDWAAAAAAYEAVIQLRPGTPAIGRAIDALEAEARRLSGRNADAETATQWQAVALRWVQEQAALAVDSAIGLGRARARLGAPDEARRVLGGAADLARVEGLDEQRCRV